MSEKGKQPETKGKYGALIQKAREPENQIPKEPENQKDETPETEIVKEKEVNLCVKVPQSLRRHWAAESKRQGVTMTEVIIQALSDRFGTPN